MGWCGAAGERPAAGAGRSTTLRCVARALQRRVLVWAGAVCTLAGGFAACGALGCGCGRLPQCVPRCWCVAREWVSLSDKAARSLECRNFVNRIGLRVRVLAAEEGRADRLMRGAAGSGSGSVGPEMAPEKRRWAGRAAFCSRIALFALALALGALLAPVPPAIVPGHAG